MPPLIGCWGKGGATSVGSTQLALLQWNIAGFALQSAKELAYSNPGRFSPSSRAEVPDYKGELDNRVRGWRLILDPDQLVPAVTQKAPGVRIVLSGGILVESTPDQPDRQINLQRGDFFWQDANTTRAVRNAGDSLIELVELELK